MRRMVRRIVLAIVLAILGPQATASGGITLDWVTQFGTDQSDDGESVLSDAAGNIYVTGTTSGALGGANLGSTDVFVSKFAPSGELVQSYQYGTSSSDANSTSTIDEQGNIYLAGKTGGYFGAEYGGQWDAFVSKIDNQGQLVWTQQYGGLNPDYGEGIAVDGSGNVYLTGFTTTLFSGTSVFLRKYGPIGDFLWARSLGSMTTFTGPDVTIDQLGDIYIAQSANSDAVLTKYNGDGDLLWTRTAGTTTHEIALGVSSDNQGSVYMMGYTYGNFGIPGADPPDVFVSRFDESGNKLWTTQIGAKQIHASLDIQALPNGGAMLTGIADENADPYGVARDVFLRRLNADGITVSTHRFGTNVLDQGEGVWIGGDGRVYVSGVTDGVVGESPFGRRDAFLAGYTIPEMEGLPGDYNGDGFVDAADYAVWRKNVGQTVPLTNQNIDALTPEAVDDEDFVFWKYRYGSYLAAGSEASSAIVPEPTPCGLVLSGCIVLLQVFRNALRIRKRSQQA